MSDDGITVQEVFDALSPSEKEFVYLLIGTALDSGISTARLLKATSITYRRMTELEKRVATYLVNAALTSE